MATARTDLAVELREQCEVRKEDGFEESTQTVDGFSVVKVTISGDAAAKKLNKEKGHYVTVDLTGAFEDSSRCERAVGLLAREISALLPDSVKTVLVVGLGNRSLTADALGPKAVQGLIVTHHLKRYSPDVFRSLDLGDVAALTTGVLGETGMESAVLVAAAAERCKPDVVVLIDALAAREMKRLCATVQLCDTGLSPGSGVGNRREPLTRKTLGCAVLSLGIPTVVDAVTLAADLLGENGSHGLQKKLSGYEKNMIVTPKDVDVLVDKAAKLLSRALNRALHPNLSEQDVQMLLE